LVAKLAGKGTPLLLIHGAGNHSARWNLVSPLLEEDFRVYAMDRRGRGASEDGADYALEREFQDTVSMIDAIGPSVDVLGHSLGAICALEAALRTHNIRRLILYEPPIPIDGPLIPAETLDRLDAMLEKGDRDGVLTTMMLEIIQMPARDLESLRNAPAWKDRLTLAHTLPRELRAVNDYRLNSERVRDLRTPTLLLLGGKSPSTFSAPIQALLATAPHSRKVTLEGQQHIAMDTAPQLFADEVRNFLRASFRDSEQASPR
jgi:pimeloyl-ACP methyl ester carboxylesterase